MNRLLSFLFFLCTLINSCAINGDKMQAEEIALNYLYEAIEDTIFWNKIHAIEFLIDLGYNDKVDSILNILEVEHENAPQKRIGYWRCRVQNEKKSDIKNKYIDKIFKVYINPDSPDIIHAAESLAKLSVSLKNTPPIELRDNTKVNNLNVYLNWSYIYPDSTHSGIDYKTLLKILNSENSDNRRIMAYGLKYLGEIESRSWQYIAERALNQHSEYPYSTYLLSGALSTCPQNERKSPSVNMIKLKLKNIAQSDEYINKYEAYIAFGNFGDQKDFDFIKEEFLRLYSNNNGTLSDKNRKDILSAMSYALLKTSNNIKTSNHKRINKI